MHIQNLVHMFIAHSALLGRSLALWSLDLFPVKYYIQAKINKYYFDVLNIKLIVDFLQKQPVLTFQCNYFINPSVRTIEISVEI